MDAQAKKALFRSKLNAQKREKRIDSPLIRYNELDQPVCRVCEMVVKSETLWPAHQASRKHNEAINKLKAGSASNTVSKTAKSAPPKELPKLKSEILVEMHNPLPEPSKGIAEHQLSSGLPSDFFDNHDKKRQKTEDRDRDRYINDRSAEASTKSEPHKENGHSSKSAVRPESKQVKGALPGDFFDDKDGNSSKLTNVAVAESNRVHGALPEGFYDNKDEHSSNLTAGSESKQVKGHLPEGFYDNKDEHSSNLTAGSESKQVKGHLPEGFFDNKDADLRARGITPIKPDIKDEYRDYEKSIQEDLQAVDNRLEEEEYDAADMIEEAESVEQRTYRERVERLRKMKMELKSAKAAVIKKSAEVLSKQPAHEESSSDDDSDDNLTVDWRAKHL